MATPEEMLQTMLDNLKEKTGKLLNEWHLLLKDLAPAKHGEAMKILKGEHGVSHGYANLISQTFFKPELLSASSNDDKPDEALLNGKEAIAEIFIGAKRLFEKVKGDVEFAYKKHISVCARPKSSLLCYNRVRKPE